MTPLIVIACYIGLLLILGIGSSRLFRGTSEDYFVASRSIGPFMLLMSVFGTTMTAFALVGSSGRAYEAGIGVYGLMASYSGLIHSACFFLVGIRLWAIGKRYGYVTQCQFFRDRFESPALGYVLFPILITLIIPYLLIGLIGAGSVIRGLTGPQGPNPGVFPETFPDTGGAIPPELTAAVVAIVVLIYVFLGGVRTTALANSFQTIVFMITGVIAFIYVSNAMGGLSAASEAVMEASPQHLAREGMIGWAEFLTYGFIPLSVGMFPHLFQHWLTARSAKTFRLTVIAHPLFIMIVWTPCVLMGVWALGAGIETSNPNAVLSIFVSRKVDNDILLGILMAGILAAIMSSLDSQFMCMGTMFTNDIVAPIFGRKRFSDKQLLWISRSFIVGIVLITYIVSTMDLPISVFGLAVWCFSGFGALFPIAVAAVYWRRATAAGAIAAALATAIVWTAMLSYDLTVQAVDNPGEPLLIWGMKPAALMFATCLVTLVGVSLMTKPPRPETVDKFFPKTRPAT